MSISKVYRAFSELDAFSDEECERFVRAARAQAGFRLTASAIGAGVGMAVALIAALVGGAIAWRWMGLPRLDRADRALFVVIAMGGIFPCVVALAGFGARDQTLIGAIRRRLGNATCTACRFSLLGLPVTDGAVRCPECGTVLSLAALGLKEEDLLSRTEREDRAEVVTTTAVQETPRSDLARMLR